MPYSPQPMVLSNVSLVNTFSVNSFVFKELNLIYYNDCTTLADRMSNKDLYNSLNVLSVIQLNGIDRVSLAWMSLKHPTMPTYEFFNTPMGI